MTDPSLALQEQLQALRLVYAAQLEDKVAQIAAAWEALPRGGWEEAGQTFYRMVHSLAGSGAIYGFAELSAAARALELAIKPVAERGGFPSAGEREAIADGIDEVQRAASPAHDAHNTFTFDDLPDPPAVDQPAPAPEHLDRLIYLADDDSALVADLAAQIGYFGYQVRAFVRLAELAAALRDSIPQAIIVDIEFPDGNGADKVAALRQELPASLPVIFVSAHIDIGARLRAVRAGGAAYFAKPLDVGALIDRLDILTSSRAPEPYRILIVDDSRAAAAHTASVLQHTGMRTMTVNDPLRALEPLHEFHPDLILIDMYMPGCNGRELATVIRQQESYVGIPIVFLSSETDVDKQLAAMDQGGDDFLTKPIRPRHLISAVTSRVQRARALRALMVRDSLTGLLNHTAAEERLEGEIARARRNGAPLTLALIDIDHFKRVNDTYGHPTGDRVLKGLSRLLLQRLRKADSIGRYGGEEFVVILPDTDSASAARVLDQIRATFAHIRQQTEGAEFYVTFSAGVAEYGPGQDASRLTHAADQALYEAKRAGRNRVLEAVKRGSGGAGE